MSIIITVDDIPPSNNKFIGRNKRWEYQEVKKQWSLLMRSGMKKFPNSPIVNAKVHIHYTFPTKTRRDPDNYSGKMILDPLVKYGILSDDSFNNIELVLSAEHKKGVKETRVEVIEKRR